MNTVKEYWIVHVEYSQTDMNTVLVDAPTREAAEAKWLHCSVYYSAQE